MAKPEWGTKRECADCGARFYDLKKTPIICPKCETTFVIEKAKPSAKAKAKAPEPATEAPVAATEEAEVVDDEAALLKTVGIEDDDSDDTEEDGVVGDVFVEDDDEDEDVTSVLDAPVAPSPSE